MSSKWQPVEHSATTSEQSGSAQVEIRSDCSAPHAGQFEIHVSLPWLGVCRRRHGVMRLNRFPFALMGQAGVGRAWLAPAFLVST